MTETNAVKHHSQTQKVARFPYVLRLLLVLPRAVIRGVKGQTVRQPTNETAGFNSSRAERAVEQLAGAYMSFPNHLMYNTH